MGRQQARQVEVELAPVNYTPGLTPGVEGQLEGIDAALGASGIAHINALVPSNAGDADHDIAFGVGAAIASNDGQFLDFSAPLTKQIDAVWAAGPGAGGLFSGATLSADTTYHLFIIRKTSDGSLDAGFDDNISATNIPAGYSSFKRIGSVNTDVSSNIKPFTALETAGGGLCVAWDNPDLDVDDASSNSNETRTLNVPTGIIVLATMNIFARRQHYLSPLSADAEAASETAAPLGNIGSNSFNQSSIPTNTSGQIRSDALTLGGVLRISTTFYTDWRRD
jgi:hypothetical protein